MANRPSSSAGPERADAGNPTRGGTAASYAGQDLGLPATGSGSVGSFGRRLVALLIDWLLCQLVTVALLNVPVGSTGAKAFVPLGVFAAMSVVLLSTVGTTIGMRVMGLRVGSLGRATLSPVQVVVRTALLCLVIPAAIWDRDGRGLHDRAAGTIVVRV